MKFSDTFKRLRNRYRLVVMNDDTYEEVAVVKLNRLTVYIALCTLFVLLVGLTVALIVFTPLKKLIPGYQQSKVINTEYRKVKIQYDSISRVTANQEKYIEQVKKRLQELQPVVKSDTTTLDLRNTEPENN
jgi:hypothetical protein